MVKIEFVRLTQREEKKAFQENGVLFNHKIQANPIEWNAFFFLGNKKMRSFMVKETHLCLIEQLFTAWFSRMDCLARLQVMWAKNKVILLRSLKISIEIPIEVFNWPLNMMIECESFDIFKK